MMKKRSKIQKHLTKMVLAALVCTGGHFLISPAVAYADIAPMPGGGSSGVIVSGSEMTITDNAVFGTPMGKYISQTGYTTYTYYPASSDCTTLNITGSVNQLVAFAGYSSSTEDVTGHTVNLSDNAVVAELYGGATSNNHSANGNTVNINGGTVKDVQGGRAMDGTGNADGNTVNVNGGTISGGTDLYAYIRGGVAKISACDNTITIKCQCK